MLLTPDELSSPVAHLTSVLCVMHTFLALYIEEIGLATCMKCLFLNSISFLVALESLFHALTQVGLKSGKV